MVDLSRSIKIALLAGASAGCLTHQTASAQTAGTVAGGPRIEEVIVTARKREESLQEVPLAITVASAETLQQNQVTDLYGLQRVAPSLIVAANAATAGEPTFSIRGIGTNVFGSAVESSVGLVVDDVPMGRTALANIQFFDINNVQVLKGPQGMLFGKNAAAGLISIASNDPKLNTTEFFGHAQYGNLNTVTSGNAYQVNAGTNLPLGNTAAMRLTGFYSRYDGFTKNVLDPSEDMGQDVYGGRVKFLFEPTEGIRIFLNGDYAYSNGPGEAQQTYRFATPGGPIEAQNLAIGVTPGPNNALFGTNVPNINHFKVFGGALKAEFDLGHEFTLTNIFSYREFHSFSSSDSDFLPQSYNDRTVSPRDYKQTTEELRLTSPANQRFTYQGGLFYTYLNPESVIDFNANLGLPPAVYAPAQSFVGGVISSSIPQDSYAAFFEGEYKLTDALRLTAGGRYTKDKFEATTTNSPSSISSLIPFSSVSQTTSVDNNNVSYRFSLAYQFTPDVMSYFTYAKGYKGPGFNQANAVEVKEEIPKLYELGLKSTLFDNRLRLNLAAFHEEFDGFQAQVQTIGSTGVAQAATVNAGTLKADGFEADVNAVVTRGFTVSGGLLYNHTKLDAPTTLFPCYPGEPSGTGTGDNLCQPVTTAPPPRNLPVYPFGVQTVNGNPLAGAPEWTANLALRYEHSIGSWTAFVQGTDVYTDSYNVTYFTNPHTRIDAHSIYGLSLGAQSGDGKLGITLFARNLTDERVPAYIFTPAYTAQAPAVVPSNFPPNQGNYAQQFTAESFRMIGLSVDFRL